MRQCPGVIRLVRARGHDEPAHVPDKVIDALRARERNGAIDLPNPGRRTLRIGDRVRISLGVFAGRSGLCVQASNRYVSVILLMLGAQRQVKLSRDAVELA